jgi:hypothetical protein
MVVTIYQENAKVRKRGTVKEGEDQNEVASRQDSMTARLCPIPASSVSVALRRLDLNQHCHI